MGNATLGLSWLIVITLFLIISVTIVPQGSRYIVQRFGKFNKIVYPGLNFIIPIVDSIAYRLSNKEIVLDVPLQEVITKDNVVIETNAVA